MNRLDIFLLVPAVFFFLVSMMIWRLELLAVAVLMTNVYMARSWSVASGPFVFTLLFSFFHFGMVFPIMVLDAPIPLVSRQWLFDSELVEATSLSALGLLVFAISTRIYSRTRAAPQSKLKENNNRVPFIFFFIFASCYVAYGLATGILLQPTRYFYLELRQSGMGSWLGIFRELSIISAFFTIAMARKSDALIVSLFSLAMLLPMFLMGQRGFFIVTAAAMYVCLVKKGIRFPRGSGLAAGLFVFFLIPVIRNRRGGIEAFADGFWDPIYEMGQQIRVVVFTIQGIDSGVIETQFFNFYTAALGRIIPNIGGIRSLIGGQRELSPSFLITDQFNNGGAGLGMTPIAEAYWSFGVLGVVLFFVGFSWLFVKLERLSRKSNFYFGVYGSVLGSFFWLVRADTYSITRPLAWSIVFGVILILIQRTFKNSSITK